jgi:predicted alpha/beta-fold hydrolase
MTEYFVLRYTGFPNLQSYLNGYALTGHRLAGLDLNATLLLADDDPVIPIAGLADMHIPDRLKVCRTSYGGHCGFLEGPRLRCWADSFILQELDNAS